MIVNFPYWGCFFLDQDYKSIPFYEYLFYNIIFNIVSSNFFQGKQETSLVAIQPLEGNGTSKRPSDFTTAAFTHRCVLSMLMLPYEFFSFTV